MSLRDEMAKTMYEAFGGDIARVNFEHAADALMPLVERALTAERERVARLAGALDRIAHHDDTCDPSIQAIARAALDGK